MKQQVLTLFPFLRFPLWIILTIAVSFSCGDKEPEKEAYDHLNLLYIGLQDFRSDSYEEYQAALDEFEIAAEGFFQEFSKSKSFIDVKSKVYEVRKQRENVEDESRKFDLLQLLFKNEYTRGEVKNVLKGIQIFLSEHPNTIKARWLGEKSQDLNFILFQFDSQGNYNSIADINHVIQIARNFLDLVNESQQEDILLFIAELENQREQIFAMEFNQKNRDLISQMKEKAISIALGEHDVCNEIVTVELLGEKKP